MIKIGFDYSCEKVSTQMNRWKIGKNSVKNFVTQNFYSHLNMEYMTDADYTHTKRDL